MLNIMRNCPLCLTMENLTFIFSKNTKLNLVKIISNNFDHISTKIIKFHTPMFFRLVAMIETKVLTYSEKYRPIVRKRSLNWQFEIFS